MNESHILVLRTLFEVPDQTAQNLGEKTKGGALRALFKDGLIDVAERKGVNYYSLTAKGARKLSAIDAGSGAIAGARQAVSAGPWKPKAWTPAREGSLDAYQLPTLDRGERIERRRPLIIGGAVEAVRQGRS
jgi:DNA-binding PadR family transcriptional regulator